MVFEGSSSPAFKQMAAIRWQIDMPTAPLSINLRGDTHLSQFLWYPCSPRTFIWGVNMGIHILPATNTVNDKKTTESGDEIDGTADSREQSAHLFVESNVLMQQGRKVEAFRENRSLSA